MGLTHPSSTPWCNASAGERFRAVVMIRRSAGQTRCMGKTSGGNRRVPRTNHRTTRAASRLIDKKPRISSVP